MTTVIDLAMIIQFILTAGLGMIGFFLKGIYSEIKQLATDVRNLSNIVSAQEAHRADADKRLSRLEDLILKK